MLDTSPADDNGRLYDYADANYPDDDWEPVSLPAPPWWTDQPIMTMVRTLAQAKEEIKNRRPFQMGDTLHAIEGWNGTRGYLPWPDYHDSIKDAVYVVISYATPIGWIKPDGTQVVPDVGYTPTTGQHQMLVQDAWGMPVHYPARGRKVVRPEATHEQYGRARRLRRGGIDGTGDPL